MFGWWPVVRNWLILRLAGDSAVVMNVTLEGTVRSYGKNGIFAGNRIVAAALSDDGSVVARNSGFVGGIYVEAELPNGREG